MPNGDTFPFFLTKDEEACGMETGGMTAMSYQDAITNFCKVECAGGIKSTVAGGYIDPASILFDDEGKLDLAYNGVFAAHRDAFMYQNTTYLLDLKPFPPFLDMDYPCDNEGFIKDGKLTVCSETGLDCTSFEGQQVSPPNSGTPIIM